MKKVKKSWEILSDEQKKSAIEVIIRFYSTDRNEEIGYIAAEDLLDMFLQTVGTQLYNKGVADTKEFVKNYFEGMNLDLEALKK